MLSVKVGDVLEFDALSASTGVGSTSPTKSEGRSLTTGRVIEVFLEDGKCTVQVSPYEPLLLLDLKQTFFKVVYEAGEMRSLLSEMVGWEIELESADTKRLERGVVKQVDCDINCTLVLFAGGRKEWLDLTFFRVKIPGHQTIPTESNAGTDSPLNNATAPSSPTHKQVQSETRELPRPRHSGCTTSDCCKPHAPVAASQLSMPRIDSDQFEWHLEGTHVELCDRDGKFLEGAALCSKTNSHLQLYSERRGFYEIACDVQGFKVVIHGLENLKTFPMGQIIDVYSPLIGHFRTGTVLKAAVVGHLTPIRFAANKAVEWTDLKSQTFKLVFLPHITNAFEHLEDQVESRCHSPRALQEHPQHKSHGSDSHRSRDLEYPQLHEGQGIEIFDDHSKQYVKFKVAAQSNWSSEAYIFEPLKESTAKHVVSSLPRIRSRLLLQPAQWEDYRRIIVGHRVDVYDRVGKSVKNGKIHAAGSGDELSDKPIILVRFKDGHQTWIDLRNNKVKLRMYPSEVPQAVAPPETLPRMKISDATGASTSSELLSADCSPGMSTVAVHPATELTQSNSTPALFRISSGEDLENTSQLPQAEAPTTTGSPGRKPTPGKRIPALHRRASQSTDVAKHHTLPEASVSLELPTTSPNKGEDTAVSTLTPTKLNAVQEAPGIDDFVRPVSPRGPLPPVQTNSNPNSPGKTQLPVGLVQAAREPNVGIFEVDHEHIAA
ncbi:hypothetical protein V7S43_011368 [Phytophthora oleae]|uniref:Telomeric single stranded DNA binding POT1/Cdc13 domain-containing protein n=1 Tax=Phytophthora oleae TaxID=2107226 RepID=A0ABD3F9D5_9STRA